MSQFLKYLSARLFFGTFAAIFIVFGILIWVHEVLYAGQAVEDGRIILWSYSAVVLITSVAMSLWGRWRVRFLLERELDRLHREYHPELLVLAYRRLMRYLESCYFFPISRERLSRSIAGRFGEMLLGMRIEDDRALSIYEEILERDPENHRFYDFLIRAYSRQGKLSERSFDFLRRRYHERPDDRLVGVLSREYTLRKKLNFESERVLQRCLKIHPRHQAKVLRFVIPRLLSYKRTDDNAALFYLAAAEAGLGAEVGPLLRQLDRSYRDKSRNDDLAFRLARVLHDYRLTEDTPPAERGAPAPGGRAAGEGIVFEALDEDDSEGTLRLEGLDYGEDSLERQPLEEPADFPKMSLDSRLHNLAQLLFARSGPTVGRRVGWLRPLVLVALLGVLGWTSRPFLERTARAFGKRSAGETVPEIRPGEPSEASASAGRFAIQVGAFSDSGRAAELARGLERKGLHGRLAPSAGEGRKMFRVQLGEFNSDSAAVNQARALQSRGLIEEWRVVPAGEK